MIQKGLLPITILITRMHKSFVIIPLSRGVRGVFLRMLRCAETHPLHFTGSRAPSQEGNFQTQFILSANEESSSPYYLVVHIEEDSSLRSE
jgi:hypothetical protein